MKRWIQPAAVLGLFLSPALGLAAYVIELTSGAKFVTPHYWSEGDQIKFQAYGGVMGIEKARIRRITETDAPPTAESTEPKVTDTVPVPEPGPAATKEESVDVETYQRRKADLEEKLRLSEEKFTEAALKGDIPHREAAKRDYDRHRDAFFQLRKQVMEKHNGKLPDWW